MVTRGQALYRLRTGAKGSGTLSVVHGGKGVRHFADCAQDCMGSGTLPVTYRGTWGQTPRFIGDLL